MQIKECKIKNFGKYHAKNIAFQNGLNIIYGKNESGKTTLYQFMKSMFFGLEKQRGRSKKMDAYSIYEPWEMALYYEGVLTFEAGGKSFRIERGFSKSQKYERLINEQDGEELNMEQGDLVQILDGLNEFVFSNTIAVAQGEMEPDQILSQELKNYTASRLAPEEQEFRIFSVINRLKESKKQADRKKKMLFDEKNNFIRDYERQEEFYRKEASKKTDQITEYQKRYDKLQAELMEQEVREETRKDKVKKFLFLLAGTGLLGIVLTFLLPGLIPKASAAIITILFIILYYKFNENVIPKQEDIDYTKVELKKLAWGMQSFEEEQKEFHILIENIRDTREEISINNEKIQEVDRDICAYDMAIAQISNLADEIQAEIKDTLHKEVSNIIKVISNGKYDKITVDEQLSMKVHTEEKLLQLRQLSKGTMDELNFSLRMAVGELFFQEEKMPILLDDAFAYYDEERLVQVLLYLADSNRQVLIFTCHKREQQLLNELQIKYHYMELM